MKKRSKITLLSLLALIMAFGLILTGCPDANGGGEPEPEPDVTAPAKVTNLRAVAAAANTAAYLVWTDPTDADFDHVEITGTGIATAITVAKGVQFKQLTGLTSAQTGCVWSVVSVDTTGNKSEAADSTSFNLVADSTGPSTVTAQAAATGSTENSIDISWTLPNDTDIRYVTVAIDDGAAGGTYGETVQLPGNATSYTWTDLVDTAGGYIFQINAIDWAENTGTAAVTTAAHPKDTTAPAAVTTPDAATGDGAGGGDSKDITVTWTDPTDEDLAGIVIRVYSDSSHTTQVGTDISVASGTETKVIGNSEGLSANTLYYIKIFAVDFADNESEAATASARSKS